MYICNDYVGRPNSTLGSHVHFECDLERLHAKAKARIPKQFDIPSYLFVRASAVPSCPGASQ